jgi:hypothetical protein
MLLTPIPSLTYHLSLLIMEEVAYAHFIIKVRGGTL